MSTDDELGRIATTIRELSGREQSAALEIGALLQQAHRARAWTSAEWSAWCETEAGISGNYGQRMITFVRVRDALARAHDEDELPQREGQARALGRLLDRPALLDQAWERAVDTADGAPTGADVEAATAHVIAEADGRPPIESPPTTARLRNAARRAVKAAAAFHRAAAIAMASDDHDLMVDAAGYGQRVAINLADWSAALLLLDDHDVDSERIEVWRQAMIRLLPGKHLPEPPNPGTIDNDLDRPKVFPSSGELAAQAGRPRKLPGDDEPWG